MIRNDKEIIEILEKRVKKSEAVLDKIRAEIEEYIDCMRWDSESLIKLEAINYVLKLIDKYKAEIEPQESEE